MNGAEAPENRVRVLRRALMYFGGGGLPEAKFRFIWPYRAQTTNRHISHSTLRCGADTRVCRVETRLDTRSRLR